MAKNERSPKKQYKHFHIVPGSPVFPKPPKHSSLPVKAAEGDRLPETHLSLIFARAYDRSTYLRDYLHSKIVKGTGCKLLRRKDTDTPNYPIKGREALHNKAKAKYKGEVCRVTDALRFRITFNTYNQYNKISNKFLPQNNPNVLEYEPGIRFDLGKEGPAIDQIVMRDPETGLCYEVQIMHEIHHKQNRATHEAYEHQRAIEKRHEEVGEDNWRSLTRPAKIRRRLNEAGNEQAQVAAMRYGVTYALTTDAVPFAAIWPCAYDDPLMYGPKYLLAPALANNTLIDDPILKERVRKAIEDDNMIGHYRINGKNAFMHACQDYCETHHPGQNRRAP